MQLKTHFSLVLRLLAGQAIAIGSRGEAATICGNVHSCAAAVGGAAFLADQT